MTGQFVGVGRVQRGLQGRPVRPAPPSGRPNFESPFLTFRPFLSFARWVNTTPNLTKDNFATSMRSLAEGEDHVGRVDVVVHALGPTHRGAAGASKEPIWFLRQHTNLRFESTLGIPKNVTVDTENRTDK